MSSPWIPNAQAGREHRTQVVVGHEFKQPLGQRTGPDGGNGKLYGHWL